MLLRSQLQKTPRLESQEGQRYDFCGREKRAHGHVHRWFTGKVNMMHAADHSAGRIEDDVQVDDFEGHAFMNHAQKHKHVGDHNGSEKLEEVLDPEMDNPEAPKIRRRKV